MLTGGLSPSNDVAPGTWIGLLPGGEFGAVTLMQWHALVAWCLAGEFRE